MEQITSKETMTWVSHAIAYFNNVGKNQKDLAKVLGIEESRLSEMKHGTAKMSPSLMERIVDACGAPRRGTGRFESVEIYDNLASFFELFDRVSNNRFFSRLNTVFSRDDYIKVIASKFRLESNNRNVVPEKEHQKLTINKINELLRSTEFEKSCRSYEESLKPSNNQNLKWRNYENDFFSKNGFKMNGLIADTKEIFHILYLQFLLRNHDSGYKFANDEKVNINPLIEYSPVVITGKKILTMSNCDIKNAPINCSVIQQFGEIHEYNEIPTDDSLNNLHFEHTVSVKPDLWSEVLIELYLSEAMNYHLLIHLSKKSISKRILPQITVEDREALENGSLGEIEKDDRVIVIQNINILALFNYIDEIKKWCALPLDTHYKLKQEIAIEGGYVPGAKVLV